MYGSYIENPTDISEARYWGRRDEKYRRSVESDDCQLYSVSKPHSR